MRQHAYHDFSLRYPDQHIECDFGPLRVRVPALAWPRMSDSDSGYSDAVFFDLPDGTVRLSVLAAPRQGGLWAERAEDIATERARLGDLVRAVPGEWGVELQITDATTTNRVIGIDGPRWMLLGRSTSELGAGVDLTTGADLTTSAVLAETMREMMRTSVVSRGDEPLPARTPLPLTELGSAAVRDAEPPANPYTGSVELRIPRARTPIS